MSLRRISAALLALAVVATIATRLWLNMEANGWGMGQALWRIFRFFTIWTNVLVAGAGLLIAWRGHLDGRIGGGLLLAIGAVAIVYHTLLAGLTDYRGLEAVVDDMMHIVVPVWFALHWLAFEPKARLRFSVIPLWLAYPAFYCAWALLRAQFEGRYPYPFLNIAEKGLATVLINMAGLLVAFTLGGAVIVLVARALSPRRVTQQG